LTEDAGAGGESELQARAVVESSWTSSFSMVIDDASDGTVWFGCMTKEWIYLGSVDKLYCTETRLSVYLYLVLNFGTPVSGAARAVHQLNPCEISVYYLVYRANQASGGRRLLPGTVKSHVPLSRP
jgi:hypothetical protein